MRRKKAVESKLVLKTSKPVVGRGRGMTIRRLVTFRRKSSGREHSCGVGWAVRGVG